MVLLSLFVASFQHSTLNFYFYLFICKSYFVNNLCICNLLFVLPPATVTQDISHSYGSTYTMFPFLLLGD